MLKLRDEETKQDIKAAFRSVKPPGIYSNDDLTPLRAKLLYLLRRARPMAGGKLVACGSTNGSVYALIKPPDSTARNQRLIVNTMDKLESLCERALNISFTALKINLSNQ